MKRIFYSMLLMFVVSTVFALEGAAFSDVKKDAYYEDAVKWAVENKVVSGYPDGTFKPNRTVTYDQFIKIYTNTFKFNGYSDAKTYSDYYAILEQYNLVFYEYETSKPITRGDVSVLLAYASGELPNHRYNHDLYDYYEDGAKFMLDTNISTGQSTGKDLTDIYGSENTLTRGQAVTFLHRMYQKNMTVLPDAIKYIVEPPLFEQQEKVVESYNMGNGILYHVLQRNLTTGDYEVVVTMDNFVVGGYVAIVGEERFGYKIGETYSNDYNHTYYSVVPHIDEHNNNEVRAISYSFRNTNYDAELLKAMTLYDSSSLDMIAQLYADLANEFRVKNGSGPLQAHPIVTKAAKAHSVDMATRNYFSHDTLEGLSVGDRLDRAGLTETNYGWGENIAAGQSSIFEFHTAWINSLGHRNNMLRENYTHIGFGVGYSDSSMYDTYATTNFAILTEPDW